MSAAAMAEATAPVGPASRMPMIVDIGLNSTECRQARTVVMFGVEMVIVMRADGRPKTVEHLSTPPAGLYSWENATCQNVINECVFGDRRCVSVVNWATT